MPALEWADVWIDDPRERSVLERRALFFVPGAFSRLYEVGVQQPQVLAEAHLLKARDRFRDDVAGRAAIQAVFRCDPVTYASARGFLTAANAALAARSATFRLTPAEIVACVFRLKDAPDMMTSLDVTVPKIAQATGIKLSIVQWAMARWRISYVHANAIWHYLRQVKAETGATAAALNILSADPRDFIKTDNRSNLPMAIQSQIAEGQKEYVYQRDDLVPAPLRGHPWALERDAAPSAP